MLKKYVSKFAMDILPSVAATIIGAYIVNHYIVTKPGADAPVAAAASPADPKRADAGNDARLSGASAVANIPEPGVKAKGISEKAMFEKSAAEQPATAERPADKSADKPAETASIPAETRRHQPSAPREKAIAKIAPAPAAPSVVPVAAAPVVAAPNTAPAVEAATAPDDHRDANDLARAAIERLRGAGDSSPRAQEAARIPDPPRVAPAPVASAPPVRPLPPPIMVSTPRTETFDGSSGAQIRSPYPGSARIDDPSRPIPPADIPEASRPPEASHPLDLRAEVVEPAPRREHTTVAEDVLSAARSVFHAVLPKNASPGSY
jgi:hypothetical protein